MRIHVRRVYNVRIDFTVNQTIPMCSMCFTSFFTYFIFISWTKTEPKMKWAFSMYVFQFVCWLNVKQQQQQQQQLKRTSISTEPCNYKFQVAESKCNFRPNMFFRFFFVVVLIFLFFLFSSLQLPFSRRSSQMIYPTSR